MPTSRTISVAALAAAAALLAGCSLIPGGGETGTNGGDIVSQIDDAYRQLDELQQGLGEALGVTWESPTAIGPAPCSTGDGETSLEVWLDRPATSDRPIEDTLALARSYLGSQGLEVDPTGFEEFRDGELFADRVTGRRGHLVIGLRAATNGSVTVTGVSECISGDWTGTGWQPPAS